MDWKPPDDEHLRGSSLDTDGPSAVAHIRKHGWITKDVMCIPSLAN